MWPTTWRMWPRAGKRAAGGGAETGVFSELTLVILNKVLLIEPVWGDSIVFTWFSYTFPWKCMVYTHASHGRYLGDCMASTSLSQSHSL